MRAPLFVIAEEVIGEALATLVVSKLQGIFHVAAIKTLGFGEHRKPLLQDLAILASDEFQVIDLGLFVENISVEQFGIARRVTISKNSTTSIADTASKNELRARIAQHELQWEDESHNKAIDPPFDYIIGTDAPYVEYLLEPLYKQYLLYMNPGLQLYSMIVIILEWTMISLWQEARIYLMGQQEAQLL
ncbi:hypothetical protein AHAS_Ahas15G0335300 [Arachis hypogaea]